jgi:2-polyprenyl-3-methyl-5-hydroxy-6-metoxy-1,4-benzoquinol methylase
MQSEKPLATELRELWARADKKDISREAATAEQDRLMEAYRKVWREALLLNGESDFTRSTLAEIASKRGIEDLNAVRLRCEQAVTSLRDAWNTTLRTIDTPEVDRFYDETEFYIDELMWWHTLNDDDTPLAYVAALKFAESRGLTRIADFGSGVGSGGLLFARHGFSVTLADISSVLLDFCRWRFQQRNLAAQFVDLKSDCLPAMTFDLITAMDVFEHLTKPVETLDLLAEALAPGGYIFGRFAAEIDPDRPMHIVQDFAPVFERFHDKGFTEVWRDDWLWGHQVFRKPD